LPKAQVDQYSEHQKQAFLKAFNNAYDEYGGDEQPRICGCASRGATGRPAWQRQGTLSASLMPLHA
jgi:cation transport regulator ChaB